MEPSKEPLAPLFCESLCESPEPLNEPLPPLVDESPEPLKESHPSPSVFSFDLVSESQSDARTVMSINLRDIDSTYASITESAEVRIALGDFGYVDGRCCIIA
jgi:hypothetical protein